MPTFYHKTERRTTRSTNNPDPASWSDTIPENWGKSDKLTQNNVTQTESKSSSKLPKPSNTEESK